MKSDALATRFGAALRRVRAERGLTQEQVSEQADISQPFYARLERGQQLPSVTTLVSLARVLQTSTDRLLDLAAAELPVPWDDSLPSNLRAFARKLQGRPPREIRFLSDVLVAADRMQGVSAPIKRRRR